MRLQKNYQHFPFFLLLAIGEAVWVCMEIFCLQRALTYEKNINWKPGTSFKSRIIDVIIQVVCFYVGLNFLRFELLDSTMWKFWIFTQVLITIVPGLELEKRGYRKGNNLALHIVYLATFEATKKWTQTIRNWGSVYGELCIMYEGRLPE